MSTLVFQPTDVYIALGSNIEPESNLPRAVALLREHSRIKRFSSVYQTAPQGDTQQAYFLNMAVMLRTPFPIVDFKRDVLLAIEQKLKRVRDPQNPNAARTIDLDIALWGDTVQEYGDKPWRVPDPDILRYVHVALPLAEIAPEFIHPETGEGLAIIAERFTGADYEIRGDVSFL